MSQRVLIVQTNPAEAKILTDFFAKRGDAITTAADIPKAFAMLARERPDIVLLDMHIPGEKWYDYLVYIREHFPQTRLIVTNKTPDMRRELLAKDYGVTAFLRTPFTTRWIENALKKLEGSAPQRGLLPAVRVPMRLKITVPYAILALMFALAALFLVSRYILETIRERFVNQLASAAILADDWMVQEEDRLLETLRLLANTEGMSAAIAARDAEQLRLLSLPVAINYTEEAVHFLDTAGVSLLSLIHKPGGGVEEYDFSSGDIQFTGQEFVQKVQLQITDASGDKYAGLLRSETGDYFYIAGPIFDPSGAFVGVVIIGKSLSTLAEEMRTATLAQVNLYTTTGEPIASTLFQPADRTFLSAEEAAAVQQTQLETSSLRPLQAGSSVYSEIHSVWEARGGEDIGILGVALPENLIVQPSLITRVQIIVTVLLVVAGIVLLGLLLARHITHPLMQMVRASSEVAKGNLEVKVPPRGNDEVTVLASAFNHMVARLQEGIIYRDLLGRTVSPEVREALRLSFATGELRLEGQSTIATVLMTDIRDFTQISEREEPTTVLQWLNEYFGELAPVVAAFGGVVDKFEGDAMLAFFGILPTPIPPEESAWKACQAAVKMLAVIERINQRRSERGEQALITGIGVHTGTLTAGGLGTTDRLNYTIIGDTVNTAARMQTISRETGGSAVIVSENVLSALKGRRGEFRFDPMGEHAFKGKQELLWLYRLCPLKQVGE